MPRRLVATLLMLVAISFVTENRQAHATTTTKANCTVTTLAYDQHLFLVCSGDSTNYFGYLSSDKPNCTTPTTVTIDTLKIWESMLMSTFLSGHLVDVYFVTGASGCGDPTTQFIYNISVHQ